MHGPRIFLCWKYMMLYFRESRKHKYALEGLYLQASYYSLLSPVEATDFYGTEVSILEVVRAATFPLSGWLSTITTK